MRNKNGDNTTSAMKRLLEGSKNAKIPVIEEAGISNILKEFKSLVNQADKALNAINKENQKAWELADFSEDHVLGTDKDRSRLNEYLGTIDQAIRDASRIIRQMKAVK